MHGVIHVIHKKHRVLKWIKRDKNEQLFCEDMINFIKNQIWCIIELQSLSKKYHTDGQKHIANTINDIIFAFIGSLIINVFFYLSLTKSKKFINNCLIFVNNGEN